MSSDALPTGETLAGGAPPPADELRRAVRDVLPDLLDDLAALVARRLERPAVPAVAPVSLEKASADGPAAPDPEAASQTLEEPLASRQREAIAAQAEQDRLSKAAREESDALGEEIARLTRDRDRLEEERGGLEEKLTEARGLVAQAEKISGDKTQLEAQRGRFEEYRRAGEEARALLASIWPTWMRDASLADWKSRIEGQVFTADTPVSLSLLFAALHGYTAALRDPDPKTLLDALRDVGRRLYPFLREGGGNPSETDCAQIAERWAQAINDECAGRCEVEVPVPGNAANNQWMIFQPRGGSSPDVAGVRSWCVRDAQKRPVHRAEVTV